jgi:hypothetical protein
MRKELLAALLISAYWIIAGFVTAYAAWEQGYVAGGANNFPTYHSPMPDAWSLGLILMVVGLILTFVLLRTLLPSRATQRRRLMRLLDEAGIEDVEVIQRKLNAVSSEYSPDELQRAASLEALLREPKRKNRAD